MGSGAIVTRTIASPSTEMSEDSRAIVRGADGDDGIARAVRKRPRRERKKDAERIPTGLFPIGHANGAKCQMWVSPRVADRRTLVGRRPRPAPDSLTGTRQGVMQGALFRVLDSGSGGSRYVEENVPTPS
jgi:hypothetical protein